MYRGTFSYNTTTRTGTLATVINPNKSIAFANTTLACESTAVTALTSNSITVSGSYAYRDPNASTDAARFGSVPAGTVIYYTIVEYN